MVAPSPVVSSHLTLHYRIALAEAPHTQVLSTFGGNPATLVLGSGELAPSLEHCLAGLEPGAHSFLLGPEQAFGNYRKDLVRSVPNDAFPESVAPEEGKVIEFAGPDGVPLAGVVKIVGESGVLVDFNHPLAGRAIRFEVEILAVL